MQANAVSSMSDQELENILLSAAAERTRRAEVKNGTEALVAKVGDLAEYLNTATGVTWVPRVLLDPEEGEPRAMLQCGPWQLDLRMSPNDHRSFVLLELRVPKPTTKARQFSSDWAAVPPDQLFRLLESARGGMLSTTKGVMEAQLAEVQKLIEDFNAEAPKPTTVAS